MKVMPPCKVNGVECDHRYVGCSADCEAFHEFLVKHEEEKRKYREDKNNLADDFLIRQTKRIKLARRRDYMRRYKRR